MIKEQGNFLEELSKIFQILFKHTKLIILTTIITAIVAMVAVLFVVKPKYQSTSEIIVTQKLNKGVQAVEQQQIQSTDLQLVNTYKSILSSQTIENSVKHSIGSKNYGNTKLSVNTDNTSQVISLNVTSYNPDLAKKVANKTAEIFKRKVKEIMNVNNVYIISKARSNNTPVSPKKTLSVIAGIIVGIFLGVFLSLFKEYNAKTIDSIDYITNDLGLTNLGTISDIDSKRIERDIKH